jgi:HEAT repeat protein
MLDGPDPVTRAAAATLLGEVRAPEAVAPLGARLGKAVESEDEVRETVVRSLRAIGDPRAVHPLVDAAARDSEADLAVAMVVAAFELAGPGQDADLRRAADVLVQVMSDDGAPHAARRDAGEALCARVTLGPSCHDHPTAVTWWHDHRDAVTWRASAHQFVAPASGG